eukprot:1141901-Pelagomonas_calceolata.AAC.4
MSIDHIQEESHPPKALPHSKCKPQLESTNMPHYMLRQIQMEIPLQPDRLAHIFKSWSKGRAKNA